MNNLTIDEVRENQFRGLSENTFYSDRSAYLGKVFKEVMAECVSRLYMKSLIIENAAQYEENIRPFVHNEVMNALSSATTGADVKSQLENASSYITHAFDIADEIVERHDPILAMRENGDYLVEQSGEFNIFNNEHVCIGSVEARHAPAAIRKFEVGMVVNETSYDKPLKEFPKDAILDSVDRSIISAWEKDIGSDIYAKHISDKIYDVYSKEEEATAKEQERVQSITNALGGIKASEVGAENGELAPEDAGEVVAESINVIDSTPKSLFNAIYINKSRAILTEAAAGKDASDYTDSIMTETICTYTLIECIHMLGIHTYSDAEKKDMVYRFDAN